jgi:hypothetical protein
MATGRRARRWILGGAAVSLLFAAALRPVTMLELENAARGEPSRIPLDGSEQFSVTSQHSIYDQPVTEEFAVAPDRRIVLRSVASPSAAVREYFGLTGARERHPMDRAMREIVFRIAAGTPQRLQLGGRERSFLDFGDHGDRLVLRAIRRPAVARWLPGT